MTNLTFNHRRYGELTEITCSASAPLCPGEAHWMAVITHIPHGKWHVRLAERWTNRPAASFPTLKAAKIWIATVWAEEECAHRYHEGFTPAQLETIQGLARLFPSKD
jgi:hypothetical protein